MPGKGVTPPSHFPPPICDFRFWIFDWIQNRQSKIQNGGVAARRAGIPLLPRNCKSYESRIKPLSDETGQGLTVYSKGRDLEH